MSNDGRKTAHSGPQVDHRSQDRELGRSRGEIDRLIVALAATQHGVVTLEQLVALGLSRRAIRWRIASGRLHPIHRGVYAVGRPDVTIKGKWMAAVLACGEGALLSHQSAATLHGLLNARSGRIHVTVPRRTTVARPGIRVHRSTCLAPQDRDEVDGIPCTSVPATLLGIAASAPRNVLESASNRAEMEGLLDMRAIDELLTRRKSHPGATRLRAALEVDGLGLDRTKSKLEKRFLRLARETGLPAPAINAWMPIPGEEMQCDFVWHRERVVVEVDAWETHGTRRAFRNDRRRDRLLRAHGWDPVRVTGHDVESDPDGVIRGVQAMLERPIAERWMDSGP
jgi:very-short-patch-repair endonuclease